LRAREAELIRLALLRQLTLRVVAQHAQVWNFAGGPVENFDTVENLRRFVDAGAPHLILNLRSPYPEGIVTRLAEEVVARVRS